MNWKEFIRPTKGKIIVSLSITLLFFLYVKSMSPDFCSMCIYPIEQKIWPDIINSCDCAHGSAFSKFAADFFKVLILPFALTYIAYSLVSYLFHRPKLAR